MPSDLVLMTLSNTRANGVRTFAAWCLGRGCKYFRFFDVGADTDDVLVRDDNLCAHTHATEMRALQMQAQKPALGCPT
jgi:hypothetical protein